MPIRPYLEERAFNPEVVKVMGRAFENVCRELGLSEANDLLAKIVARTVIDAAEVDCRDPALLTAKVMKHFRLPRAPDVSNVSNVDAQGL